MPCRDTLDRRNRLLDNDLADLMACGLISASALRQLPSAERISG